MNVIDKANIIYNHRTTKAKKLSVTFIVIVKKNTHMNKRKKKSLHEVFCLLYMFKMPIDMINQVMI